MSESNNKQLNNFVTRRMISQYNDKFVEQFHNPLMLNLDKYIEFNQLFEFEENEHYKLKQLTEKSLNKLCGKLFGEDVVSVNNHDEKEFQNGINNKVLSNKVAKMIVDAIDCAKNVVNIATHGIKEWNKSGLS